MDDNNKTEFLQNITDDPGYGETIDYVPSKQAFVIILCIFCVFGVVGNASLIFLVIRFPNLRTMPNILMINLTFGDLLYIVGTLPSNIRAELALDSGIQSLALCKFVVFLPIFALGACVYSMMALSVERYCAIVRGLEMRSVRTSRRVTCAMLFIWGMAFLVSSPVLYSAGFLYPDVFPTACVDMLPGHPASIAYECVHFIMLFILPLCTMALCYSRIAIQLLRIPRGDAINTRSNTNFEARKRLAIAIIVMALFFGFFWLPAGIMSLYHEVNFKAILQFSPSQIVTYHLLRRISRMFAYTNSCFNPWILYFISTTHRRAIANCLCCCRKNSQGNGGYRMVRMRTNGRTGTTYNSYTSEAGCRINKTKAEDI